MAEALELPGLVLRSRDLDTGTAKLELTLQLAEGEREVAGWIEYNTDLFERATAERLAAGLGVILAAFPGAPGRPASELPLLAPVERQQLLGEWNATGRSWPEPALLHELFERQAARTPGAPAVSFGGESLTYGELDERANRLARALRGRGVGPEVRVGLCVERSPGWLWPCWASSRRAAPTCRSIPAIPPSGWRMILEDSAVAVLVTEGAAPRDVAFRR